MKPTHILAGLAAAAVVLTAAPSAEARPDRMRMQKRPAIAAAPYAMPQRFAQNMISPSRAKAIAKRRAGGGEVVDIARKGNRYRVRVIRKDGRVVDVLIDAATGRVLN